METELLKRILIILLIVSIKGNIVHAQNNDTIQHSIVESDSLDLLQQRLFYNEIIMDSLKTENTTLKNMINDSQREIEIKERENSNLRKKVDLQDISIKKRETTIDTLQRKLISMASNFLYIPYDQYSIEEIAIPAFEITKGSSLYTQYSNRLPLFREYRQNIQSIIDFLEKVEKDTAVPLASYREKMAAESIDILNNLPVCRNYSLYDDWENTYLGQIIVSIKELLISPNESTPSQLRKIKENLKAVLD